MIVDVLITKAVQPIAVKSRYPESGAATMVRRKMIQMQSCAGVRQGVRAITTSAGKDYGSSIGVLICKPLQKTAGVEAHEDPPGRKTDSKKQ